MSREILKWLAAVATGAAAAAVAYLTGVTAGPEGVDSWVAGLVVGALAKLANWLTSKLPPPAQEG